MIFLDHLGSNQPVGKSEKTRPKTMHIAMAAGMIEIAGKKHVVKLA
jgi:hypothetical protein